METLSQPLLTLNDHFGDLRGTSLVVDQAVKLSGVARSDGRDLEAVVVRRQVDPLRRPQDHRALAVEGDDLGLGGVFAAAREAAALAVPFQSVHEEGVLDIFDLRTGQGHVGAELSDKGLDAVVFGVDLQTWKQIQNS